MVDFTAVGVDIAKNVFQVPARAGLQPEAHDRDPGYEPNDEGDQAAGGVSLFNGRCNALGDSGACQVTRFCDEATG